MCCSPVRRGLALSGGKAPRPQAVTPFSRELIVLIFSNIILKLERERGRGGFPPLPLSVYALREPLAPSARR